MYRTGLRLRALREERGIPFDRVAFALDVFPGRLLRMEDGRDPPPHPAVADYLECCRVLSVDEMTARSLHREVLSLVDEDRRLWQDTPGSKVLTLNETR